MGWVPGLRGFYPLKETPEAKSMPGVLIYQFSGNIVFYNAERFKLRLLRAIARSPTTVEWVVLDGSPVNYVDLTALQVIDELRVLLASRDIKLVFANRKPHLLRFFDQGWRDRREAQLAGHFFPTIRAAVKAFEESKGLKKPSPPSRKSRKEPP